MSNILGEGGSNYLLGEGGTSQIISEAIPDASVSGVTLTASPSIIAGTASAEFFVDVGGLTAFVGEGGSSLILGEGNGAIVSESSVSQGGTIFDLATANANLAVQSDNVTVSALSANAGAIVRSVASFSTGSVYSEFLIEDLTASRSVAVGICNATKSTATGQALGDDLFSVGVYDDGRVYLNGLSIGQFAASPLNTGDTICIAVARTESESKFWARANGDDWNNDPSADPDTDIGGFDISAVTGAYYLAVDVRQ